VTKPMVLVLTMLCRLICSQINSQKSQYYAVNTWCDTLLTSLQSAPYRVGELQGKIKALSEGEYAVAKQDVDRLRKELGQPPLPSLQATIEEKSAQ
jgi:hypothetical protein